MNHPTQRGTAVRAQLVMAAVWNDVPAAGFAFPRSGSMGKIALAVSTAILVLLGAVALSTAQDREKGRSGSPTRTQVQEQPGQIPDELQRNRPGPRDDDLGQGTMQQRLDGGDGD
jgi:hypothetical protein